MHLEQKLSAAQMGIDAMEAYKFRSTQTGQVIYVDGGWLANRPLSQSDLRPSLRRTKVSCNSTAPCGS